MEIINFLQSFQSDIITAFFKLITFFGNWEFYLFGMPILYWLFNREKVVKLYFIVFPSALFITYLKQIFHAPRPEGVALIEQSGYSFPSAHAAGATVLFLMLAMLANKKWVNLVSTTMILLISISRVYLGVHYPIDVIGGIAIGSILVLLYQCILYESVSNWTTNKSNIYKLTALTGITGLMIFVDKINTYNMSIIFGLGIGLIFIEDETDAKIESLFKRILLVILGSLAIYLLWTMLMNGLIPMTYFSTFIIFTLYGVLIVGLPKILYIISK